MEKTTRKLNDLLSQFLSLRNEVSEIADKTADFMDDYFSRYSTIYYMDYMTSLKRIE